MRMHGVEVPRNRVGPARDGVLDPGGDNLECWSAIDGASRTFCFNARPEILLDADGSRPSPG